MAKKPVLLCIMDGFGWVPEETFGNAVVAAKKPHLDALMAKYPMTTINASGMAVGLPDGQMGNSEVGHTNMGAGRIVYQQLTLITKSIHDGEMLKNPVLVKNMKAAIEAGKAIHLMGLVGTGGVHSHADHWFGVLEMAKHLGAKEVYLHCITDGRDTDPLIIECLGKRIRRTAISLDSKKPLLPRCCQEFIKRHRIDKQGTNSAHSK